MVIRIVIHPPDNGRLRAFRGKEGSSAEVEIRPVKPYLERDRDIVADVELLIACPGEFHEINRSGTWYTVRRAGST
ncbi:MAG TPA: hypothetical protein VIO37_10510 [Candidatus Dormibacteraeota bacterium]